VSLAPRLEARQQQSLAMTPQLQQAIKLLQMGRAEVWEFVEQQVLDNPLLEFAPPSTANGEHSENDNQPTSPAIDSATLDTSRLDHHQMLAGESPLDISSDNLWDSSADLPSIDVTPWQISNNSEEESSFEERTAGTETLSQHLEKQLGTLFYDRSSHGIALFLIDQLDDAGYFRGSLEEMATLLDCPLATIEWIFTLLQRLEPTGVFARSLQECFHLQLQEQGKLDAPMKMLLAHLELFSKGQHHLVQKRCMVDDATFARLMNTLRSLDPKPGHRFLRLHAETLVPDVTMKMLPNGDYKIELSPDTLPKVLVNQSFSRVVKSTMSKDEKQYVQACYQSANWLSRALHQRASTMLNVAIAIVERQEPFFKHGIRFLQPMVLRDLAGQLGVHESTISRIVTGKYMTTPRGIFELKYFFTSGGGVAGALGDTVSSQAVKHRIGLMIQKENPKKPLSDEQLVAALKLEGIDIARRTVAKYREALRLPSSAERKRGV
jgi:RNA polymerase sigma-54 factor